LDLVRGKDFLEAPASSQDGIRHHNVVKGLPKALSGTHFMRNVRLIRSPIHLLFSVFFQSFFGPCSVFVLTFSLFIAVCMTLP